MSKLSMADPIEKGERIWFVDPDGGIYEYGFVEKCFGYSQAPVASTEKWVRLTYGLHPRQRCLKPADSCCRTRRQACVMASERLRRKAKLCVARASELEAEAAEIEMTTNTDRG